MCTGSGPPTVEPIDRKETIMTTQTRTIPVLALVAGAAFALMGALELAHEQPEVFVDRIDFVIEAVFAVALGVSAAALVLLARGARRVARVAFGAAALGHVSLCAAAAATHMTGRPALGPAFVLGLLLALLGLVALLVLDLARRLEPAGVGLVLAGGFVGGMILAAIAGGGGLAIGAGWFAAAQLVGRRRPAGVPVPAEA
jgi:hypothetical protein